MSDVLAQPARSASAAESSSSETPVGPPLRVATPTEFDGSSPVLSEPACAGAAPEDAPLTEADWKTPLPKAKSQPWSLRMLSATSQRMQPFLTAFKQRRVMVAGIACGVLLGVGAYLEFGGDSETPVDADLAFVGSEAPSWDEGTLGEAAAVPESDAGFFPSTDYEPSSIALTTPGTLGDAVPMGDETDLDPTSPHELQPLRTAEHEALPIVTGRPPRPVWLTGTIEPVPPNADDAAFDPHRNAFPTEQPSMSPHAPGASSHSGSFPGPSSTLPATGTPWDSPASTIPPTTFPR